MNQIQSARDLPSAELSEQNLMKFDGEKTTNYFFNRPEIRRY